jgi:hypothetical protein
MTIQTPPTHPKLRYLYRNNYEILECKQQDFN